jgi:hypothetical protein
VALRNLALPYLDPLAQRTSTAEWNVGEMLAALKAAKVSTEGIVERPELVKLLIDTLKKFGYGSNYDPGTKEGQEMWAGPEPDTSEIEGLHVFDGLIVANMSKLGEASPAFVREALRLRPGEVRPPVAAKAPPPPGP